MEAAKIGPDLRLGRVSQTRAVVETCPHEEIHRRTLLLSSNQEPMTLVEPFNIPRFSCTDDSLCSKRFQSSFCSRAFQLSRQTLAETLATQATRMTIFVLGPLRFNMSYSTFLHKSFKTLNKQLAIRILENISTSDIL